LTIYDFFAVPASRMAAITKVIIPRAAKELFNPIQPMVIPNTRDIEPKEMSIALSCKANDAVRVLLSDVSTS